MAATVDTRSPVPTFRRTPVVKDSPICLKVYRDALHSEKKSFQSDCVRNNEENVKLIEDYFKEQIGEACDHIPASKITKLGSQTDKTSENPNEKRKVTAKRLPSKKEGKDAGKKRAKKSETTDMPKRPATSFILFMQSSFKEEFKKQNPAIKTAVTLSKSAGTKWKSMSEEEKLPYIKLAAEEKAAYQTKLESYKSKQSTEDKEKHAACSGSDSSVLQSTDLNILEVVGDNMIDFSINSTPNII